MAGRLDTSVALGADNSRDQRRGIRRIADYACGSMDFAGDWFGRLDSSGGSAGRPNRVGVRNWMAGFAQQDCAAFLLVDARMGFLRALCVGCVVCGARSALAGSSVEDRQRRQDSELNIPDQRSASRCAALCICSPIARRTHRFCATAVMVQRNAEAADAD